MTINVNIAAFSKRVGNIEVSAIRKIVRQTGGFRAKIANYLIEMPLLNEAYAAIARQEERPYSWSVSLL